MLTAEHAPLEDAGARALVWAYCHEQPAGTSRVGGTPIEEAPIRIAVTTPAGALDNAARQELAVAVGEIVDDLAGPIEGWLNHWAMIYEVDEGSWAGGNQIFPLAGILAAISIKPALAV